MNLYLHAHMAYMPDPEKDIPDLVALALVSENGNDFYGVLSDVQHPDEYIVEKVSPSLMREATEGRETPDDFRERLRKYLSGFKNPIIFYTHYMHYHYMQILGFGNIPGIKIDSPHSTEPHSLDKARALMLYD